MKSENLNLKACIEDQLLKHNITMINLSQIPSHHDKAARLRLIEEILDEFENSSESRAIGYLIQVKPSKPGSIPEASKMLGAAHFTGLSESEEELYLPDGKPNFPYLMRNAELLTQAGDFHQARSIYFNLLTSHEKQGLVLLKVAQSYEAQGRLAEAKKFYEDSITFEASLEGYQRLAAVFSKLGSDLEAAHTLERSLAMKHLCLSDRLKMHQACGNAYTRAKILDHAILHFQEALKIDPHSDELLSNQATVYLQLKKFSEAKSTYQQALRINPKNALAIAGLGTCAYEENEKELAYQYFSDSLKLDMNNPAAIYYLVKCAFETKSYSTACKFLENYIELVPVNTHLLFSLASLQFHLGKFPAAESTTNQILELQPKHTGANELLGLIKKYTDHS
ncbi:MAG: tetratricopeptide repeat protein [Bdellovibrionia bacterium]